LPALPSTIPSTIPFNEELAINENLASDQDRGRRALIVFRDGEDNSSAHQMMDAIEAAQANDVLLFSIPRGPQVTLHCGARLTFDTMQLDQAFPKPHKERRDRRRPRASLPDHLLFLRGGVHIPSGGAVPHL